MKIIKCKYCGKEFETDGSMQNAGKITAHMRVCEKNPNCQKNIEARKRGSHIMNKKRAEFLHQQKLQNEATRKPREFICKRCQKVFYLDLTDREYEKYLKNPLDHHFKKYCSRKCANSRPSKIKNFKKKESKKKEYKKKEKSLKEFTCKNCEKTYFSTRNLKFCSEECKIEYSKKPKHRKLSAETLKKLSEAGKRSAAKQSEIRRSKNEIYFCELCEKSFKHVEHNKPIFNGWDADVLIYDFNIAVLWNGKWHYVEIMKTGNTLKRIQTRDKIKEQEIKNANWICYVIKDMGKYNIEFVENEFQKFKEFVSTL